MHTEAQRSGTLARFETLLASGELPLGDLAQEEIAAEVAPVLDSLSALREPESADDLNEFEFRECFALVTLLGRRLALLDLTPTAALGVAATVTEAARVPALFARPAIAASMEGFVRGREERVDAAHASRLSDAIGPVPVSSNCYLLMPAALDDAEVIAAKVDELARKLFAKDARVAIVDFSQMGAPTADSAAALLGAEEMTKMLGAQAIFSGMTEAWKDAAREAGIDLRILILATDLAEALELAVGFKVPPDRQQPSWMHRLWDKLSD